MSALISRLTRPTATAPSHAADRRARIAASAAFAVQGLCFAAVIVPGARAAGQVRPRRHAAHRRRSPPCRSSPAWAACSPACSPRGSAAAPCCGSPASASARHGRDRPRRRRCRCSTSRWRCFGLFLGAVDATMNMQGVAVQRRYGRSILASCHAWWSIAGDRRRAGGDRGRRRRPARRSFLAALAAVVGVVVALAAGPRLLKRAEEAATRRPRPSSSRRPARASGSGAVVLFVGVALMVMFIGDAATTSWSGVFLQDVLGRHDARSCRPALFAYLMLPVPRPHRRRPRHRPGRRGGHGRGRRRWSRAAGFARRGHRASSRLVALAGFALVGLGPVGGRAADVLGRRRARPGRHRRR